MQIKIKLRNICYTCKCYPVGKNDQIIFKFLLVTYVPWKTLEIIQKFTCISSSIMLTLFCRMLSVAKLWVSIVQQVDIIMKNLDILPIKGGLSEERAIINLGMNKEIHSSGRVLNVGFTVAQVMWNQQITTWLSVKRQPVSVAEGCRHFSSCRIRGWQQVWSGLRRVWTQVSDRQSKEV